MTVSRVARAQRASESQSSAGRLSECPTVLWAVPPPQCDREIAAATDSMDSTTSMSESGQCGKGAICGSYTGYDEKDRRLLETSSDK